VSGPGPTEPAPAGAGSTAPAATATAPSGDRAPAPGVTAGAVPVDAAVVAAITAAVDQVWPRPRVAVEPEPAGLPAWRFSGRWWARPTVARRDRPW
jgi:hypothetical protein